MSVYAQKQKNISVSKKISIIPSAFKYGRFICNDSLSQKDTLFVLTHFIYSKNLKKRDSIVSIKLILTNGIGDSLNITNKLICYDKPCKKNDQIFFCDEHLYKSLTCSTEFKSLESYIKYYNMYTGDPKFYRHGGTLFYLPEIDLKNYQSLYIYVELSKNQTFQKNYTLFNFCN